MNKLRRGLAIALVLAGAGVAIGIWAIRATAPADNREPIVFWGSTNLGEDIYTVVHQFERKNPQYKVIMGTAAARDLTGDAQRLLCAIAGGVPQIGRAHV